MGNYDELKQAVSDVIKTNGNEEITGQILQNTLLSIINIVGANATFAGVATPVTNPGTPDQNVFYIASKPGTYTSFNEFVIDTEGKVYVFVTKNGNWQSIETGIGSLDAINKKRNSIFSNDSYNVLPEFSAIVDMWIDIDSTEIPEDMELYVYFLSQSPTPDVKRPTFYVKKGANGQIGEKVTDIIASINQPTQSNRNDVVTYVTEPYPGVVSGIKFGVTIDWSLVNYNVFRTSDNAKINKNELKIRAKRHYDSESPYKKTIFPFISDDSDISLLNGFGIYGITMNGTPSDDIESIGIGYIGYDENNSPKAIRLYFIKNNTLGNSNIIALGYINETDVVPGINEMICVAYNNSGVSFVALIDGNSFLNKKLITTTKLRLNIDNLYNPLDYISISKEWQIKGLVPINKNIGYFSLPGIIDVKLLYDRDGFLKNNEVYFWAYGNYIDRGNNPRRYVYFTKEKYVNFEQSVVCYTLIVGNEGQPIQTQTEKFIVKEVNNSGLSFIVTIDWSKVDAEAIDNSTWIPVNKNIPIGIADSAKQTFFIPDAARLQKIVDGFILDIKIDQKPNVDRVGIWYITNEETDRRVYVGVMTDANTILGGNDGIYARFIGAGYSDQIENITLTPNSSIGANTTFYMTVDWSKLPKNYISQIDNEQLGCTLNIDNIPLTNGENGNFVISDNMPILPSQIFLRNDISIPMFKNSLFTKMKNLADVDVNLICNVGNSGKRVIEINEPTNMGGSDGEQIKPGAGRMFLSRTSDYNNFIFKDIEIFLKDVSSLSGKTVKVMSLGDSLTQGLDWKNIPVCMLSDELQKIGVTTQFIGSLARNLQNKQSQTIKLNYEGRGGWRYRTMTGLESTFAGLNVIIPSDQTKHEWLLGVDGTTMNQIKANHTFLYPATEQDKQDYPDFCYHFIVGNTGYNQSYSENPNLGDYVIFDPIRYFSERSIDIPDILTIAFGTNEWYLGGFDLDAASRAFKFMVQQFRRASSNMKIVVIPANALNMRRQSFWETQAGILTAEIIRVTDDFRLNGDNNIYVCPIYAQSSRWLAWDKLVSTPVNIAENYDTKTAVISNDVHSLYDDDESNDQYADSLTACVVNIIE